MELSTKWNNKYIILHRWPLKLNDKVIIGVDYLYNNIKWIMYLLD